MKYFEKIPKEWKQQEDSLTCSWTGRPIDPSADYFEVTAHWKIKDEPDRFVFSSLDALTSWAKDDGVVQEKNE